MIDERAPLRITRFDVVSRRLEGQSIDVRDPAEADVQCSLDPNLAWLAGDFSALAATHFVHPDNAAVSPRTPEALAAGLYLAEPEVQPTPIPADWVFVERDRRLALGFDFDFGDARGVHHIGTTAADLVGWTDVTTYAGALIAAGQGSGPIDILTDTGAVTLTADEWQQVLLDAAAFRQPLWLKSFEMAGMSPIPLDYVDDHWWST